MEYLFELTTVLAGLKNLPTDKTGKLEKILHEGKKGNSILMFGREVSFGRTRRGFINFKQSEEKTGIEQKTWNSLHDPRQGQKSA